VTVTATYPNSSNGSASLTMTAIQTNALLPSVTSGTVWTDYLTDVVGNQYITGVNPFMIWNTIESSKASGSGYISGGYDFTSFDQFIVGSMTSIFPSGAPTKKINILALGVSGGCAISGNCGNKATPKYVLTGSNGSNGVPELTCSNYPGDPNTPNSGFPEVYDTRYYTLYRNFMKAVLQHYSSNCSTASPAVPPCSGNGLANGPSLAPYIGYIRFGLSAGGEVYPFCEKSDSGITNYTDTDWLNYVSAMDTYEDNLGSPFQMMTSVNENKSTPGNYTLPNTEASDAQTPVNNRKIGFGSQGLQISDISNYNGGKACTSNWCSLFGTNYNYAGPLELQTTLQSDPSPTGSSQTGSLCQLIPFAVNRNAHILEIYAWDLLYAYDSNFCTLPGSPGTGNPPNPPKTDYCDGSNNRLYPQAYSTRIANAANGVAQGPMDCTN
jgi:hypothetical protein